MDKPKARRIWIVAEYVDYHGCTVYGVFDNWSAANAFKRRLEDSSHASGVNYAVEEWEALSSVSQAKERGMLPWKH